MISSKNTLRSKDTVAVLDVGGTTITAAIVGGDKSIIPHEPVITPVNHEGSLEEILETMIQAVAGVRKMSDGKVLAVGIAMPGGPNYFDYEHGISHVKFKFRKLYGQNIKTPLQDALGLSVYFMNDSEAFALGAWWAMDQDVERLLGITLGTGLGACFLVEGVALRTGPKVPKGGEIWNIPWRGKMMEDFVSRRFIEGAYARGYREHQGLPALRSVKGIADAARDGNQAAQYAFQVFAENLGHILVSIVPPFRPDSIVLGGQIAKAFDLFSARAQEVLTRSIGSSCPLVASPLGDATGVLGVGYHCFRKLGILR